MAWPHGDPDAVIKKILADPAYGGAAKSSDARPHESLLLVLWDWFVDHVLRKLFGPIAHAFTATRGIGTVFGYVLVALALGGLAYVVFRLILAFVRGTKSARTPGATATFELDEERSAADWRALARAAAARGEYGRAIAALFSAALAELDERAIVTFDAARTPGEYRRLVRRARPPAEAPFDELAERFVHAAYAPERPGPADYEAAERALAALAF